MGTFISRDPSADHQGPSSFASGPVLEGRAGEDDYTHDSQRSLSHLS